MDTTRRHLLRTALSTSSLLGLPSTTTAMTTLPNTIRINADGDGLAAYEFTVSGALSKTNSSHEDTVQGTRASGHLGPKRGVDTFRYAGNITGLTLAGPATLFINGHQVSPDHYPQPADAITAASFPAPKIGSGHLRIKSTGGGVAVYEFTVSDSLTKTDSSQEDTVQGLSAYGHLGPKRGIDEFLYRGQITRFVLAGPAAVFQNDTQITGTGPSDVAIHTGSATRDPNTPRFVTLTGQLQNVPRGASVRAGFEYQDYNAMWGELDMQTVTGHGTIEFTSRVRMPYIGRDIPYRAVATVSHNGSTTHHAGDHKTVSIPNFIDTVDMDTVDVTVDGTTANVVGRVADFGKATALRANAEVSKPGSQITTSRTQDVHVSVDGERRFTITNPHLDPNTTYVARTVGKISTGPVYAKTYGEKLDFKTG